MELRAFLLLFFLKSIFLARLPFRFGHYFAHTWLESELVANLQSAKVERMNATVTSVKFFQGVERPFVQKDICIFQKCFFEK